jgi:hypothetical protein
VNGLILPYPYLLYLWGRGVSHIPIDQSDEDILHHVDKPFIGLILLRLVRLYFEAFCFDVAILTTMMAWGRIPLRIMLLLQKSMMSLGRFRARLTCLLLYFLDRRLLMSDLRAVRPDVSRDTTTIAGRLTLFAEMLLEGFCKFKISTFASNKVLTSLRYMPSMGRNIFFWRGFLNTALFGILLLFPRSVGF